MTGPQHYVAAEQLLEHAAAMLDTDVDPSRATELVDLKAIQEVLGHSWLSTTTPYIHVCDDHIERA